MAPSQSLFWSQSRGLLIRSWHYQRRETCSNLCNLLVPPLLLVLLVVLNNVLQSKPKEVAPFQQTPLSSFAARPFEADQCLDLARELGEGAEPACLADPFQNKVTIPFYGAGRSVLDAWSLTPFLNPSANASNWFDAVFLNQYGGMNLSHPLVQVFTKADSVPGELDRRYGVRAEELPSKAALEDKLFDSWYTGGSFSPFKTAYGFEQVSGDGVDAFSADVTVYYNQSRQSQNSTRTNQVFSSVQRLDAAIFAVQNRGKTAAAFLRRYPDIGFSVGTSIIPLVISIVIALLFHFFIPFFLSFLVYERESRLRELMSSSGMGWKTYWFSTYIALYAQYALTGMVLIVVGRLIGVPFFTLNTPLSYLPLFIIWGHLVIAHAVLLAPFFTSAESSVVLAWLLVILINFVGGPYIGTLSSNEVGEGVWNAVMLLPSFSFFRGVYYAGALNAGGQGVTRNEVLYQGQSLAMCGEGPFCKSFIFLIAEWFVFMGIGLYLDQVFTDASGVRKHPLFFLGYHSGRGKSALDLEAESRAKSGELDGVAEERRYVEELVAADPSTDRDGGIIVNGLHKIYAGSSPPVHAVRGVTFAARRGEVCGLLGSNGSGKTSLIRCLIGAHAPSAGDAWLDGKSIRSELKEIHSSLGICLQQDIQWESLSVEEHLYFFGRLRNIPKAELKEAVEEAMEGVDLLFARKRKSAECSGGMRRRISVAMSLLGNPSVVILDEPTGPLDPATTEKVWQAIAAKKEGKTIIITTHSMEEAKVLCDRVHMCTRGLLRTTGNPEDLRLRLGSGYRISASVPEAKVAEFHDMVMALSGDCRVETQLGGNLNYSIPKSVALSSIFNTVAAHKDKLGIRDWGISQSSLEDVFLNVVAKDELEVGAERDAKRAEDNA